MYLYEPDYERSVYLSELYSDYKWLKREDVTTSESFAEYIYNVVDATIRGGNDCELVDYRRDELKRFMNRLWKKIDY